MIEELEFGAPLAAGAEGPARPTGRRLASQFVLGAAWCGLCAASCAMAYVTAIWSVT